MASASSSMSAAGYAVWRLIAEELRSEILSGVYSEGERLPSENALVARFGVNRHTVRRALGALADGGLVESRQGVGVFVADRAVYTHRIGLRTRFSASVGRRTTSKSHVLNSCIEDATTAVSRQLDIEEGSPTLRVETVNYVDGSPFSLSDRWFDHASFPDFVATLQKTGSVTQSLRALGVHDYLRSHTTISARHATESESRELSLPYGSIVLVAEALDVQIDGKPLQYLITKFAAQRVRLSVDSPT